MTAFTRRWTFGLALVAFLVSVPTVQGEQREFDVVVYGATPAGIAAAVELGREGHTVLVAEPTRRIGGMITNGLSHPDFRTFEGITGAFADLADRTRAHYAKKYGEGSAQVETTLDGTHAEPRVSLEIFREMLSEWPSVTVRTELRLADVDVAVEAGRPRVGSVRLVDGDGEDVTVSAAVFVDATYEGDLLAAAGVPYRVGREGRDEHGESLAPERADDRVQGYNFRLTVTANPENRVYPEAPAGYDRADYLPLLKLLQSGKVKRAFHVTAGRSRKDAIYKVQEPRLPNGKHDVNDMSHGFVRLSLPQINNEWPDGNHETRTRLFAEHVRHNVGTMYFLQNDEQVPEAVRNEVREWGLCRDEFVDSDHLPVQLYVREARRMVGRTVFTQRHVEQHDERGTRARFAEDAVAMGDYGPNCHGTGHEGPRFGGRHTGEFYHRTAPYQIPYGVLLPKRTTNLIVPVAVSSSHVGFCALRLEPIWMSLGQAAGVAAHLALETDQGIQSVSPSRIRERLHERGAATIYTSDVPRDAVEFRAVQWWGSLGGLHGLHARKGEYGQRGEHLRGQYYHAFPGHTVGLDRPLDAELRAKWTALARRAGVRAEVLDGARTRGDFLRAAWRDENSRR